jgi:hypothetical protein
LAAQEGVTMTTMRDFVLSERGAITVDWVVLTAAIVALGLAASAVVIDGVGDTTGDIETFLMRDDIIITSFE